MAATPRKFSEKIALLNQKEAEGTAEFDRIMREVSVATNQVSQTRSPNLIATSSLSPAKIRYRGGSLPNVNNDKLIDTGSPDLNHASKEDAQIGHSEHSPQNDRGGSTNDLEMFTDSGGRESRGRSVGGGPMRSRSRNIDTSPYSNNVAYLSPPTDSGWRRTSSDSAIHQSLTAQDHGQSSLMLSPRAQKRISSSQSNSMKNLHQHHHIHQNNHQILSQQHSHSQQHMNHSMQNPQNSMQNHMMQQNSINNQHLSSSINNLQDMKSRSTKLPNISIYPSPQTDGSLQIPIGNATGSLPDLTQVHFQSPLSTPLDQDQDQLNASNSYNTNASYSMPMASTNMGAYQQHPQQMSNNSSYSPKHYNKNPSSQGIQQFNQQHATNPITIDQRQPQQQHSPNHHAQPSYHQFHDKLASYRNTASPSNLSSSQGNLSKNNISGYRSPHNRPSPGSSPGANQGLATNFDSNSSAPCSPSPQMAGVNGQTFDQFPDNYCINPSIQQHFEQFSLGESSTIDFITGEQNYVPMLDSNGQQHSPTNNLRNDQSNNSHANSNNNSHQQQQHNNHTNDNLIGNNGMLNNYSMMDNGSIHSMMSDDLTGDNGVNDIMLSSGNDPKLQINSSNSSLHTSSSLLISTSSPQHLISTNTTTSIPEIIFSDYSSSIEYSKDYSDSFGRPLDLELGQMDFAGLQMLSNDSTIIADPITEDSFRRDLH